MGLMILGAFIVTGVPLNILVLLVSGVIGYALRKLDVPLAPIALTMVLGPILEENLVRALLLSDGDLSTLVSSPFSAMLMAIALCALIVPPLARLVSRQRRRGTPKDPGAPTDEGARPAVVPTEPTGDDRRHLDGPGPRPCRSPEFRVRGTRPQEGVLMSRLTRMTALAAGVVLLSSCSSLSGEPEPSGSAEVGGRGEFPGSEPVTSSCPTPPAAPRTCWCARCSRSSPRSSAPTSSSRTASARAARSR